MLLILSKISFYILCSCKLTPGQLDQLDYFQQLYVASLWT